MSEYTALLGMGRKFGGPWRPMEQGLVEKFPQRDTESVRNVGYGRYEVLSQRSRRVDLRGGVHHL